MPRKKQLPGLPPDTAVIELETQGKGSTLSFLACYVLTERGDVFSLYSKQGRVAQKTLHHFRQEAEKAGIPSLESQAGKSVLRSLYAKLEGVEWSWTAEVQNVAAVWIMVRKALADRLPLEITPGQEGFISLRMNGPPAGEDLLKQELEGLAGEYHLG